MTIRWFLAEGREEDRETEAPDTDVEIVILKTHEDYDGAPVEITYAYAGSYDLLGWDLTEIAAMRLYHHDWEKTGADIKDRPLWAYLPEPVRRMHIRRAQAVLGSAMEHLKEKRDNKKDT